MIVTYASETHRSHHPRVPFLDRGQLVDHPEVPARADRILAAITDASIGDVMASYAWGMRPITRVHNTGYLEFLEHAHARWRAATGNDEQSEAVAYARAMRGQDPLVPQHVIAQLGWYSHDSDPVLAGTWAAALGAVDVTMSAWQLVEHTGTRAYALARPPGHHAAADSFAGYCYLNNAAIAANAWTEIGARVAIVDVDYHHGNGTQQIFYERDDVLFVSLHADPAEEYPFLCGFASEHGRGPGTGFTHNYPLPMGTTWDNYGPALADALAVVRNFAPDAMVVSLGVDTAAEDPDMFELVADDFSRLGAALDAGFDGPMLVVQEGGYNLDVLGRNVVNVLRELA